MSCNHNFARFCSHLAQPDSPVATALGGTEMAAEVLSRLQQTVRSRAGRSGSAGSARLRTKAEALAYHQALVASGNHSLAAALNDTLQLFARMQQLNIRPPVHSNVVPADPAAWYGYAAVEQTLKAVAAQQPVPEETQQIIAALRQHRPSQARQQRPSPPAPSLTVAGQLFMQHPRLAAIAAARGDIAESSGTESADDQALVSAATAVLADSATVNTTARRAAQMYQQLRSGLPGTRTRLLAAGQALAEAVCVAAGVQHCPACGEWMSASGHVCDSVALEMQGHLATLAPYRFGATGYGVGSWNVGPLTAGDIVRDERDEKGNDMQLAGVVEDELNRIAGSEVLWVTKTKRAASRYGSRNEIESHTLGPYALALADDGEEGFFVIRDARRLGPAGLARLVAYHHTKAFFQDEATAAQIRAMANAHLRLDQDVDVASQVTMIDLAQQIQTPTDVPHQVRELAQFFGVAGLAAALCEAAGVQRCSQCGQFVGRDGAHSCRGAGTHAIGLFRSPAERIHELAALADELADTFWNAADREVFEHSRGDDAADEAALAAVRLQLDPLRAEIVVLRAADDQPAESRLIRLAEIAREIRQWQHSDELMDLAEYADGDELAAEEPIVHLRTRAAELRIAILEHGFGEQTIQEIQAVLAQSSTLTDLWNRVYIMKMLIPGTPDSLKSEVVAQSQRIPTRVGAQAAVMIDLVVRWPHDSSLVRNAIGSVLAIDVPAMIPDHLRRLLPYLDEAHRHVLRIETQHHPESEVRATVLDLLDQSSRGDVDLAGRCPQCGAFMAADGSHVCPSAAAPAAEPPATNGSPDPLSQREIADLINIANGRFDWHGQHAFQAAHHAALKVRATAGLDPAQYQLAEECLAAMAAWQVTDTLGHRLLAVDRMQTLARAQAEAAGLNRCPQCGQFIGRTAHACPNTPPVSAGILAAADWTLTYAPILQRIVETSADVVGYDLIGEAIHVCEELMPWVAYRDDVPARLANVLADLEQEAANRRSSRTDSLAIPQLGQVLRELLGGLPPQSDRHWLNETPGAVEQLLREVPGIRAIANGAGVEQRPHWSVMHPLEEVAHILHERVVSGAMPDLAPPSLASAARRVVETCRVYLHQSYSRRQQAALEVLAQELVATAALERQPANGYTTADGYDADDVEPFDAPGYALVALSELPSLIELANGHRSFDDGPHAEAEQNLLDATAQSLQYLAMWRSDAPWSLIVANYVRQRRLGLEPEQRRSATQMTALLAELAGIQRCAQCGEFLAHTGGHSCRAFNGTQPIQDLESIRRVVHTAFPPSSQGVPEVARVDGEISIQLPQADGTFREIRGVFVPTVYAEIQAAFEQRWATRSQDEEDRSLQPAGIAWRTIEHVLAEQARRLAHVQAYQASQRVAHAGEAPANTPQWLHETALLALEGTGEDLVAFANMETSLSAGAVVEDGAAAFTVADWLLSMARSILGSRSDGARRPNHEAVPFGSEIRVAAWNYVQQPDVAAGQKLARVIVAAAGRPRCPGCGRFQSANGSHACPIRDVLAQVPILYAAAESVPFTLEPAQVALISNVAEHLLMPGVPLRLRMAAEQVVSTGEVDLAAVPEFARQVIDELTLLSDPNAYIEQHRSRTERFQHIEALISAGMADLQARHATMNDEQQGHYAILVRTFDELRAAGTATSDQETNWNALARTLVLLREDVGQPGEHGAGSRNALDVRWRSERVVIDALFGNTGWISRSTFLGLDRLVVLNDEPSQAALHVLDAVAPHLGSETRPFAMRLVRMVAPEAQAGVWLRLLQRWPQDEAIGASFMASLAAQPEQQQNRLLLAAVDALPITELSAAWRLTHDPEARQAVQRRFEQLRLPRCPQCGEFLAESGAHTCRVFTEQVPIQGVESLRLVVNTVFPGGMSAVAQVADQVQILIPAADGSLQEISGPAVPTLYADIQAEFARRWGSRAQDEEQPAPDPALIAWGAIQHVLDDHSRRRDMYERGAPPDTPLWLHESARQALDVVGDRLIALANSEVEPTDADRTPYGVVGSFTTVGAWLGKVAWLMAGGSASTTPERREPVPPVAWSAAHQFLQQPDGPEVRDLARVLLHAAGVSHCVVCGRFQSADGSHSCVVGDLLREVPVLRRATAGSAIRLESGQAVIVRRAAEQLLLPGVAPRLRMVAEDLLSGDGLDLDAIPQFARQLLEESAVLAGADVVDERRYRDERIHLIQERIRADLDAIGDRYRDLTTPQQQRCAALVRAFEELGDQEYLGVVGDAAWRALAGDVTLLQRDIEETDEVDLGRRSVAEVRWWASNAVVDCLLSDRGWVNRSDFLALDRLVVRSDEPSLAALAVLERAADHLGSGCRPLAVRLAQMVPSRQQAHAWVRLVERWPDDDAIARAFITSLADQPDHQQNLLLRRTAALLPAQHLAGAWRFATGFADSTVPLALEQRAEQLGVQRCPACGEFVSHATAHVCPHGLLHEPLSSQVRWNALMDVFHQEWDTLATSDLHPTLAQRRNAIQLNLARLQAVPEQSRTNEHFAHLVAEVQSLATLRLAARHSGETLTTLRLRHRALYARAESLGYGTGWLHPDRLRVVLAEADRLGASAMDRLVILDALMPVLPDSCHEDALQIIAPVAGTTQAMPVWLMLLRRWPHDTSTARTMLTAIRNARPQSLQVRLLSSVMPAIPAMLLDDVAVLATELNDPATLDRVRSRVAELGHERCSQCGRFVSSDGNHICPGRADADRDPLWLQAVATTVMQDLDQMIQTANTGARVGTIAARLAMLIGGMDQHTEIPPVLRQAAANYWAVAGRLTPPNIVQLRQAFSIHMLDALGVPHCLRCGQFTTRDHACPITGALLRVPELREWANGAVDLETVMHTIEQLDQVMALWRSSPHAAPELRAAVYAFRQHMAAEQLDAIAVVEFARAIIAAADLPQASRSSMTAIDRTMLGALENAARQPDCLDFANGLVGFEERTNRPLRFLIEQIQRADELGIVLPPSVQSFWSAYQGGADGRDTHRMLVRAILDAAGVDHCPQCGHFLPAHGQHACRVQHVLDQVPLLALADGQQPNESQYQSLVQTALALRHAPYVPTRLKEAAQACLDADARPSGTQPDARMQRFAKQILSFVLSQSPAAHGRSAMPVLTQFISDPGLLGLVNGQGGAINAAPRLTMFADWIVQQPDPVRVGIPISMRHLAERWQQLRSEPRPDRAQSLTVRQVEIALHLVREATRAAHLSHCPTCGWFVSPLQDHSCRVREVAASFPLAAVAGDEPVQLEHRQINELRRAAMTLARSPNIPDTLRQRAKTFKNAVIDAALRGNLAVTLDRALLRSFARHLLQHTYRPPEIHPLAHAVLARHHADADGWLSYANGTAQPSHAFVLQQWSAAAEILELADGTDVPESLVRAALALRQAWPVAPAPDHVTRHTLHVVAGFTEALVTSAGRERCIECGQFMAATGAHTCPSRVEAIVAQIFRTDWALLDVASGAVEVSESQAVTLNGVAWLLEQLREREARSSMEDEGQESPAAHAMVQSLGLSEPLVAAAQAIVASRDEPITDTARQRAARTFARELARAAGHELSPASVPFEWRISQVQQIVTNHLAVLRSHRWVASEATDQFQARLTALEPADVSPRERLEDLAVLAKEVIAERGEFDRSDVDLADSDDEDDEDRYADEWATADALVEVRMIAVDALLGETATFTADEMRRLRDLAADLAAPSIRGSVVEAIAAFLPEDERANWLQFLRGQPYLPQTSDFGYPALLRRWPEDGEILSEALDVVRRCNPRIPARTTILAALVASLPAAGLAEARVLASEIANADDRVHLLARINEHARTIGAPEAEHCPACGQFMGEQHGCPVTNALDMLPQLRSYAARRSNELDATALQTGADGATLIAAVTALSDVSQIQLRDEARRVHLLLQDQRLTAEAIQGLAWALLDARSAGQPLPGALARIARTVMNQAPRLAAVTRDELEGSAPLTAHEEELLRAATIAIREVPEQAVLPGSLLRACLRFRDPLVMSVAGGREARAEGYVVLDWLQRALREHSLPDQSGTNQPTRGVESSSTASPEQWQAYWAEQDLQMRSQIETMTGMAQVLALWSIHDDRERAQSLTAFAERFPTTCVPELAALLRSCDAAEVREAQGDAYEALEDAGRLRSRIPPTIARPMSERLLSYAREDVIALANGRIRPESPPVLTMLRHAVPRIRTQSGVMEQLALHDRSMHDALRDIQADTPVTLEQGQHLARLICERASVVRCEQCGCFLGSGEHECPGRLLQERRWSRHLIREQMPTFIDAANQDVVPDELRPTLRQAAFVLTMPGATESASQAAAQAFLEGTDNGSSLARALCQRVSVRTCSVCGAFVQHPNASTCPSCTR